jgi:hypothetical protein
VIRSSIELFAFAFLITSTIVLWVAFLTAVLHGDSVMLYTNLSGERNTEIALCIVGTTASMITIPKVMFRKFLP